MKWWTKYKDQRPVLKSIIHEMMDMSNKIEEEWWQKEWLILEKHGYGSLGRLNQKRRDMFWNLGDQCNAQIHPLWVEIAAICDYLTSIEND